MIRPKSSSSRSPNFSSVDVSPGAAAARGPVNAGAEAGATREAAALRQLLASEDQIRQASSETELAHLVVDETRRLIGARQIFLLRRKGGKRWQVEAVSSLALVDRDTPLIRWIEAMVAAVSRDQGLSKPVDFALPAYVPPDAPETKSYPFAEFCWQPLQWRDSQPFAGILAARESPWATPDQKLLAREADVYAAAWAALHGRQALAPRRSWSAPIALAAGLGVIALGFAPVPLTTLAPVEIVAAHPDIVTAPIDGVIKTMPVPPNRHVAPGTLLFGYDDTVLTNRFELADREMRVARARFERAEQAALTDAQARHDLLIAKTEYELKRAERDHAGRLRAKAEVSAPRAGLLIYTSPDDWLGRPVTTGEKIMSVARPADVVARIELPVADAIAIAKGADVRLFLDAAPLRALAAKIVSESYHAEPNSANQLVYRLDAKLMPPPDAQGGPSGARMASQPPRIGARGTAQVFGATVPLAFFVFRRPIAYLRQTFGY